MALKLNLFVCLASCQILAQVSSLTSRVLVYLHIVCIFSGAVSRRQAFLSLRVDLQGQRVWVREPKSFLFPLFFFPCDLSRPSNRPQSSWPKPTKRLPSSSPSRRRVWTCGSPTRPSLRSTCLEFAPGGNASSGSRYLRCPHLLVSGGFYSLFSFFSEILCTHKEKNIIE